MSESGKKTLLLVEDEILIASSEKIALEKYGYSVLTVYTGEKAIAAAKVPSRIDLILMDINLGDGIDGTEAAEIILKNHDIPIVFLSSHSEREIVEKTEKLTSYGYVVKNSNITVLDASIKMAFKLFDANKWIKNNEAKQQAMISNISDVISIVDANGILKYQSPNIEKWFGWKPAELIGTDGRFIIHPDDFERIQEGFFALLKHDKSSTHVECRYKCRDGSYKPIERTATNLLSDPNIHGVLINYHDISERNKVEGSLRESEARFRLLFNNIDSVNTLYEVITDKSGKPIDYRYLEVNLAFEQLVGIKASDLIGKTILEVFPDTEQYWLDIFEEAYIKNTPTHFKQYSKELNTYTELNIYIPHKGQLAMTSSSIKEKLQMRNEESTATEFSLRKSEERYRRLMENLEAGIVVHAPDASIIMSNHRASELLGLGESQLGGEEAIEPKWYFVYGDGSPLPISEYPINQISISKKPIHAQVYGIAKSDKTEVVWVSVNGFPMLSDTGEIEEILICYINITERMKAEEALRQSERKYRSLIECSSDAIFCVDEQGQYQFTNHLFASTFGKTSDYFIGKTFWDIYPKEHADFRQAVSKKVFETGESQTAEVTVPLANTTLYFLAKANPIKNESGKVILNLTHATDITDRKLKEEKIKSLLAEKELLLKEAHHRVKNNLGTTSALLSLQALTLTEPSAISALEDTNQRVRSMEMLYDKLYRSANFMELSVKDYLPSLIDEIIATFPKSQVIKVGKSIQDFVLDAKRLQPLGIIINELLTNIMKYAFSGKEAGSIIVTANIADGHITIAVQDDGIGIPVSVSCENSTGFGLQLVQALTSQLNGRIRMERGNGTRFVLEFDE